MISLLLAAFAATAVVADSQLAERAGPFAFCSDPGVSIASQVIVALGPLAGSQYCYSLLNVPKTTSTVTVSTTATSTSLTTTTTTTGIGISTTTTTTPGTTALATRTTTASTTTTTTTYVNTAPQVKRQPTALDKRQSNAKGKNPGNNNNAAASGTAKTEACSCILGPDPTQTLTFSSTSTASTSTTITRTSTSTTPTSTTTITVAAVTLATTVTTPATATATQTATFQRVYNDAGGHGYRGDSTANVNVASQCEQSCADRGPTQCQFVFVATENTMTVCVFSSFPYNPNLVTTDSNVLAAMGYNRVRDTVTQPMRKKRRDEARAAAKKRGIEMKA